MEATLSRRLALALTGSAGLAAVAGCIGEEAPEEPDVDDEVDDEPDEEVDVEEWEDVDEFYFEGRVEAWTGIEPALIEGEDNPTITLIEGQEYDFRWVNEDGVIHNMEIHDEDEEVIDDYVSDDVGEEGEEATIEGVEATQEMVTYICQYHPTTQVGDIEVVEG